MKSVKSFALITALAAALSLTAAGCGGDEGGSSASAKAEPEAITLKLGHIQSEQDLWQLGSIKFKEEVEKLSNGTIKVEIFPNSTLGGDRDLAEGMKMGTVDFALIAGVLGNFDKSISILELPYLFRNHDEYVKIVNGPIGEEIAGNVLKSSGIRVLNFWDRGPRHVTANKAIMTPDDIKGLKIRVPEIPAMVDTWKAMGATPTPMALGEVYTSIQQGTIDGVENPLAVLYNGKFQEVAKYLLLDGHVYNVTNLVVGVDFWNSLTPDQQKLLKETCDEAAVYQNQIQEQVEQELLKKFADEGVTITEPSDEFKTQLREAAAKFYQLLEFTEVWSPNLYQTVQDNMK